MIPESIKKPLCAFWLEERFRIRTLLILAFSIRFLSILPYGNGVRVPFRDQNVYYSLARAIADDGYLGIPREPRGPYIESRELRQPRPAGFYPAFHDSICALWDREGRIYGVMEWGKPNSFWEPLYPLLAAALYIGFGDNFFLWRLLHIIMGALLVLLIYDIGKRAFRDERIGAIAALYTCFYPHFVFYSGLLMPEVLLLLFLALGFWAYFHLLEKPRWSWAFLIGIFFGCFTLTRSFLLAFFPLMLLFILLFVKARSRWRYAAAAALAFALTLSPWVYRNYRLYHQFVLVSTRAGYNLWMRNNPYFIADELAAMGVKFSPDYMDKLKYPEYILGYPNFTPAQGELERNKILTQEGMKFIRANPGFFLRLCWTRFLWTIGWCGIGLGPLQTLISLVSYGPALLGFLASLLLGWKRLSATLPLWLAVGYFILFYSLTHEGLRYRLPVDPYVIILAAFSALWIYDRQRDKGKARRELSNA